MRSILAVFAVAFTIALLGLTPALSQVGTIAGSVKDSSGAVLPGARAEIEQGPSAVSDDQGQFLISRLAPGSYKVTVSYVGFSSFSTSVTVTSGQVTALNAVLQVETASQTVTVNGVRIMGPTNLPSLMAREASRFFPNGWHNYNFDVTQSVGQRIPRQESRDRDTGRKIFALNDVFKFRTFGSIANNTDLKIMTLVLQEFTCL